MKRPLLVLLLLAPLFLVGCRRQSQQERPRELYAPPHNALEAAYLWAGSRLDFRDGQNQHLMRLRKRRNGCKVLDEHLTPVGYVRTQGDTTLLEGLNKRPLYVMERTQEDGQARYDVYLASLPEPTAADAKAPSHKDQAHKPPELQRGEKLVSLRLEGPERWTLTYPPAPGGPTRQMVAVHQAKDNTWDLKGGPLDKPVTLARQPGKSLLEARQGDKVLVQVRAQGWSPAVLGPSLDPELPSLVRAALTLTLQDAQKAPQS